MKNKVTILLAEDEPADVFLVRHAFRDADPPIDLVVVKDGEEAQAYLQSREDRDPETLPDLIILDINMPRMNGLETLAWIKTRPGLAEIPTIMLSGSTHERDLQAAHRFGANAYLQKGTDLEAMQDMAEAIMTLAALQQEQRPLVVPGAA